MELRHVKPPLVRLPESTEMVLFLVREDLKSQKVFDVLMEIGVDHTYYKPDLSSLVLTFAGFTKCDDALFEFYWQLREQYSKKIEANNEATIREALNLYHDLMNEKIKREK